MATSSSIDYSLTARQVIEYALRKINILAEGESATAEGADRALVELNLLCKEWMKHSNIWRVTDGYVTLVASTQGYQLIPIPYRVYDVRYRNASGTDTPMREMTRQEYYNLPIKTNSGIPTQWYLDPQRGASTIYVWPLLSSVTTETLRVTYQRQYEDVDDLGNEVDIPVQHLGLVGLNLAARLADDYGRSGSHIDRIIARAQVMLDEALDADRPEIVRFAPEARYG